MARTANFDRQVALNRAVELFWTRGYYATSMKDIEKALDMRPGSLYATFGNKNGLFVEVLNAYATRTRDGFDLVIKESPNVIDGLKCYLRSFAQPYADGSQVPPQACMLVKTLLEVNAEDDALSSQVNTVLAAFEQKLCGALKQAQRNGELRVGVECSRLARLLQTQIIGLRVFAERDVPRDQLVTLAEDITDMLDIYRVN